MFRRMVKSPDEPIGFPSKTANCAPGGRKGGAGPNLTWSGVKAFCAWEGCAANSAAMTRTTDRNGSFMRLLQIIKSRGMINIPCCEGKRSNQGEDLPPFELPI